MGRLNVRFSAVLNVLALIAIQNVNPIDHWNVSNREKGKIKWAKHCDWEGNNFDEIQDLPTADDCGNLCLADQKCTHFSWVDDTCFLKEITTPVMETPLQEVETCGFIVHRNSIPTTRASTESTTVSTQSTTRTTSSTTQTSSTSTVNWVTKLPILGRRKHTQFSYPESKFKPTPFSESVKESSTLVTTSSTEKSSTPISLSPSDSFTYSTLVRGSKVKWASKCEFTTEEDCGKLCLAGAQCTHFVWISGICFLNPESKFVVMKKRTNQEEPRCGYVANRANSEIVLIRRKDDRLDSTTTTMSSSTPAPNTPSTSVPTFSTPKTTTYTTKQRIVENQWMIDHGDRITWSYECEFFSPIVIGSETSFYKEDCAQSCLEQPACVHFLWKSDTLNGPTCTLIPKYGINGKISGERGSVCGSVRNRELLSSTQTVKTPIPTTMKTSVSTKTKPPVVPETWQHMIFGGGGFVKWNNDCKFTSPTSVRVMFSDSKENCAETCWNSATCRHFEFSLAGLCRQIADNGVTASFGSKGYVCGSIMLKLGNKKVSPEPSNTKWFEDDNGRFKWSSGCSFPSESVLSDDVNKIKMKMFSTCPENCYKDNRCTHFVYKKGYCHLIEFQTVDASPEAAVYNNPGGICGFLVERPDVVKNWNIGDNNRTRWSYGCNYPNRKFNIINEHKFFLDQSKCGDYCLSIKRCTHFSSGKFGYCWVKDMHGASVVQTVDKSTPLCGFIPERVFADAQRRTKWASVSSDKSQSRVNNTLPQPNDG